MGDVQAFFRDPRLWVRIAAAICSIIVFGCIANKGWVETPNSGSHCVFNDKSSACHFGVAVGVISLLGLLAFSGADYVFCSNMVDASYRRVCNIAELLFSGIWTIMWFSAFVFLADTWRKMDSNGLSRSRINNARSAVAFSFFSFALFIGLILFAVRYINNPPDGYKPADRQDGYGGAAEPYQEPNPSGDY